MNIRDLNLRGTELVVLSACRSGCGSHFRGEGVFGLGRAFAMAGARTVVLTLESIDDEAACKLMDSFYRIGCKGNGLPNRAQVLQRAQQEMLSQGQGPRDWGLFAMYGAVDACSGSWEESAPTSSSASESDTQAPPRRAGFGSEDNGGFENYTPDSNLYG